MKDVLLQLVGSKKVFITLISIIAWGAGRFGFSASTEELVPLVGPMWLLLLGFAGQDFGKAAKAALPEAKSSEPAK
jgi:hypothetical protein